MTERSIVVRLRAEVSDYLRGIRKAREETDGLGKQSAPQATSALDKMVKSARDNRQEWTTVGTAMGAAGAAITAVGVAALKTGIEYNTLQQSSRAALRTLTGSAEEANAQMDKLDEFARTSPFAKQVFITAQQQMLGFGIEARKVIPYLDAIQNAVAATGGSNHDIAELSRIFSQISASAKITAVDLREFGNRGIDAATIIGSQMGMTGAQIRESITAGTLDAQQALDALAAGMAQRFDGAAEGVKDSAVGAFDRVKAAWRDLSSELASPLVGPEGGGLLVDWLNSLADAMRGFQDLPGPVKASVVALGGLAGVTLTLGGAAMILVPRLVDMYDSLGKLGPVGVKAQGAMKGMAGALPAVAREARNAAIALAAIAIAAEPLTDLANKDFAGTEATTAALRKFRGEAAAGAVSVENLDAAFVDLSGSLVGMRGDVGAFGAAVQEMVSPTIGTKVGNFVSGSIRFLSLGMVDARSGAEHARDRFEELGRELAALDTSKAVVAFQQMAAETDGTEASLAELLNLMPALREQLSQQAAAAGMATDDTTLLRIAMGELTPVAEGAATATDGLTASQERAAERAERYAQQQEEAARALEEWRQMVANASGSFIDLVGGYDKVAAAAEEAGQSTKNLTRDWLAEMERQVKAQQEWADNIVALSERVTTLMPAHMQDAANAMIDELIDMGPEGAAAVAAMRDMSDDELAKMVTLYGQKGALAAANLTREVESHRAPRMTVELVADTSSAYSTIDHFVRTQSGRTIHVNVRGQQVGFSSGVGNMIGRASGGILPGAPSSTDNMVIHAASGEFVVNAKATQRHRQLLEAINRNALPAYATGGYVQQVRVPVPSAPRMAPAAIGGFPGVAVEVGQIVTADPRAAMSALRSELEWAMLG